MYMLAPYPRLHTLARGTTHVVSTTLLVASTSLTTPHTLTAYVRERRECPVLPSYSHRLGRLRRGQARRRHSCDPHLYHCQRRSIIAVGVCASHECCVLTQVALSGARWRLRFTLRAACGWCSVLRRPVQRRRRCVSTPRERSFSLRGRFIRLCLCASARAFQAQRDTPLRPASDTRCCGTFPLVLSQVISRACSG